MQRTNRGLWIALGVLILIVVAAPMLGAGLFGPGWMMWGGYGMRPFAGPWIWGFGMGIGLLFRLVFWIALIGLVIGLFRRRSSWTRGGYYGEAPEDVLDRRYASGEITREQYEEMRRTLMHHA